MFRLMIYLLIIYIIWKLVEPHLQNLFSPNPEVKGSKKQKKIDIDPDKIEDASFKEIDDKKS